MPFIITIEKQLVESREVQHILVAVEFDPYRNDTSAVWRYTDVFQYGADRDEYLRLVLPITGINAGNTLALPPQSTRYRISVTMVMHQIERLWRLVEAVQTRRA